MYAHAHLRYAEAMATVGDADAFYLALRQAIPIGVRDVVPNARRAPGQHLRLELGRRVRATATRRRRATTRCGTGAVPVEGGWRVYSSGAGIAFRLIHERLFGLRRGARR